LRASPWQTDWDSFLPITRHLLAALLIVIVSANWVLADTGLFSPARPSGVAESGFVIPEAAIGSYRVNLADNPAAMCGAELRPQHCVRFEVPI
jgi:hypothetical protein